MTDRAERPLLCPSGVELNVAASALQKSIRRSRELEATYWAIEISQRFPKYVWRRLAIIAAEDVGLANPQAIVVVDALASEYRANLAESRAFRPDAVLIVMAVMVLARSPKSREADDLKNTVLDLIDEQGWSPPIEEHVLDWHTAEGRDALTEDEQLLQWLREGRRIVDDEGPLDWRLWIDRSMARRGVLDRADVERQAVEWDQEGRLRYGIDGYRPRPD